MFGFKGFIGLFTQIITFATLICGSEGMDEQIIFRFEFSACLSRGAEFEAIFRLDLKCKFINREIASDVWKLR